MKYGFSGTLILITTLLTACGGGGGISIAGNNTQDPDPVVVDYPIAYVKRALPLDNNGNIDSENVLDPTAFQPGAALYIRDRANASAREINITAGVFGDDELYDVKDVNASYDGTQIVFAMRAPEVENSDIQPTWNIWLYDLTTSTLSRVITSNTIAEEGEDVAPYFLPDGRIVFSSTRQSRSRAILQDTLRLRFSALTDARDTKAFVLHTMNSDGSNIEQITFNQSHDLYPVVRADGKIVYLRWDRAQRNNLSLYTVKPDGSENEILYGYHSQNTGTNNTQATFTDNQIMPDGRVMTILQARNSDKLGGDLVAIDGENFIDIGQPTYANAGSSGEGQAPLSLATVDLTDNISPHGYFNSAHPLYDGTNRLLVSWSPCRLYDATTNRILPCTDANLALPGITEANPLYSLWIYDLDSGIQRPVMTPEENVMVTDAITLEARSNPTFLIPLSVTADSDLLSEGVGVLHIRSIYDLDGVETLPDGTIEPGAIARLSDPAQTNAANRPARFLRLTKATSIPDDDDLDFDNTAFGVSNARGMREILGYVPIEPDGSVKVKVPAEVAFTIDIVDSNGQRISQPHLNWLSLKPGEQKECTGCHASGSGEPHGRLDAQGPSLHNGALNAGYVYPNTDPTLTAATAGETMAEIYARINGVRKPSVNMLFTDDWSAGVKDPDLSLTYASIDALNTPPASAPVSASCQTNWQADCRTVINYEDHIQPLWEFSRGLAGNATCTNCHNRVDSMSNAQVPAGQLELTNQYDDQVTTHMVSYRELFTADVELELDGGTLIIRQIQATDGNGNPIFQTDNNGDPILDGDGNPIPVLVTVPVNPSLTAGNSGSNRSRTFFERLSGQRVDTVDHTGFMSDSELRLIREWVDNGAQYYNNPEDAPLAQ